MQMPPLPDRPEQPPVHSQLILGHHPMCCHDDFAAALNLKRTCLTQNNELWW